MSRRSIKGNASSPLPPLKERAASLEPSHKEKAASLEPPHNEKDASFEPSGQTHAQDNDGLSGENNGGQLGLWVVAANTKFVFGFMVVTTVAIGIIVAWVCKTTGNLEALENRVKKLETAINQCNINCPDVGGIQNDIDKIQENFNNYVTETNKAMSDLDEKIPTVSPVGAEINENAILDKIYDTVTMMITTETNDIKVKLGENTARIERVHHALAKVDKSLAVKVSYRYINSMQLQKKLTSLKNNTEKLHGNINVQQKNISDLRDLVCSLGVNSSEMCKEVLPPNDTSPVWNNNSAIVEVNTTLTEKIVEVNATLTEKIVEVNSTLTEKIVEVNETLVEVNATLTEKIVEVNETLVEVNATLTEKIVEVNETLTEKIDKVNKTLTEKIDEVNSTLTEKIVEVNSTLTEKIVEVNETLVDVNATLTEKIVEVNATLTEKIDKVNETLTEKIDVLSERIEKVNHTVVDVNRTLSSDLCEINSTQNRITDFIKRFGDKIWDEVDTTSLRLSNLEMASSNQIWYNILGHCFVLVIGILMFLVLGNQKPDQVSSVGVIGASSRRDVPQKSWTIRNVLDEIQRRPLEKRLCIISFYAETQNLHRRLTNSACGGTGIDQQAVLIARHENIPNLPPCQICLVFVDFNERDIILENPKREVGDLKLTTVKGARKMGGDVFVIYVRDKGSKALESGHLFNPKLMSIHNHDELKDLNSRKRVLSTYEGFSQYQIEHLSTCLNVLR